MLPPRPAAPVALRRRGAALHAGACTLRAARMPRGSPPASLARSVRAGCALMLSPRPVAPAALRRRCAALMRAPAPCQLPRLPRASPPASLAHSVRAGCALMLSLALLCSAPDALRRHCAALTRAPAPCQLPRLPRGYPAASLAPSARAGCP